MIFERHGAEESDYPLRSLQSEKKLVYSCAEKNPDTQAIETVDVEIEGPIALIETTTRTALHPENETRCFDIFTDETEEQTKKIFAAQQHRYLEQQTETANSRIWQIAQKLLKSCKVKIPYVDLINFPTKPVRVRRDHVRFLALIEVSALLHQYQRPKEVVAGTEVLIASEEDYAIAYELARGVLRQTMKSISPNCEMLMAVVCDVLSKRVGGENPDVTGQSFSRSDVQPYTDGWNRNKMDKHLKEAERAGLLEIVDKQKGKPTIYQFVKLPDTEETVLIHPDDLRRKLATDPDAVDLPEPAQVVPSQVNPVSGSEIRGRASPAEGIRAESDKCSLTDDALSSCKSSEFVDRQQVDLHRSE